jgi:outer membrane protein W
MKRLILAMLCVPALASAEPRKRFYFRAGLARVAPLERSNEMELADVDGAASLAIENGPIAGSGASISSATAFAATIGWNTPWLNHRLALETILGLPFTVKFQATGTLANESLAPTALGIPTGVMPLGPELGEAKGLPVVVTGVYDLTVGQRIRPYVGAGAAVLFATGEKVTNPTLTAISQPQMTVSPAPGIVFQGGIDARIASRIYARIDVKFIALMYARARVEHVQVATPDLPLFETVEVGTAKMSMWVNPLIIQAGIGTDF